MDLMRPSANQDTLYISFAYRAVAYAQNQSSPVRCGP